VTVHITVTPTAGFEGGKNATVSGALEGFGLYTVTIFVDNG
jgi:hypothetical protein